MSVCGREPKSWVRRWNDRSHKKGRYQQGRRSDLQQPPSARETTVHACRRNEIERMAVFARVRKGLTCSFRSEAGNRILRPYAESDGSGWSRVFPPNSP